MANNSISSAIKPIVETSSRCLNECVTAAHNFEVTRYSLLEGMGAEKYISSSNFSVDGYDWNIRIYPDGWKEEDKAAYMSAFLSICSNPTTGVKVKFNLSLLEKDGKVSNLKSDTCTFHFQSNNWGCPKFIDKSKLKELLSRNDDCITIRCVLTVIKEPRTEDSTAVVLIPQSDLQTHFTNMLKDGEGVDVKFNVGDQLFNAHRCVLAARSPVFKAELFGQMKETTTKCIKIDDMEPDIFEHLLVAADRYGLDRLKAMCEGKLCQKIDVQTVATTLALAEQHHAGQLKNACLRYLSSQEVLRAVKETDGFKHLMASCPGIMMDILEKVAPPSGA